MEADKALKEGTVEGLHYLGVDHRQLWLQVVRLVEELGELLETLTGKLRAISSQALHVLVEKVQRLDGVGSAPRNTSLAPNILYRMMI